MDSLIRLRIACLPIRPALGWRRSRDISLALVAVLKEGLPDDRAAEIASAVAGVKPRGQLTVGEAMKALEQLGVRLYRSKLYRLARRGGTRYWLDANGHWDAPQSSDISAPLAELEIVSAGAFTRFKVTKVQHKS